MKHEVMAMALTSVGPYANHLHIIQDR